MNTTQNTNVELFLSAKDVAAILSVSVPFAYKLIRQMNNELEKEGFMTIAGRVSRKRFIEKFYGLNN
ncbi:DNA-binding protein [uncultured Eubacterium sp.]|uniref:DNA-binding protein n=1 Tax=uncultured Eubacterium sp. TaxID=165185 RepID=UPI002599B89A|nr:DNA-binding protein [uncultured Eubacterium sp.]